MLCNVKTQNFVSPQKRKDAKSCVSTENVKTQNLASLQNKIDK